MVGFNDWILYLLNISEKKKKNIIIGWNYYFILLYI